MITAYQLSVPINGKKVQFIMKADASLKPARKIDVRTANKWDARLSAVAHCLFKERNAE